MRWHFQQYEARRAAKGQNDLPTAAIWWVVVLGCPTFWALVIWWALS